MQGGFSRENFAAEKQLNRPTYDTGLQFLWIDERDRDALVSYIANIQLKRIRMMREHYLLRYSSENEESADSRSTTIRRRISQAVIGLIALTALTFIIVYFINYSEERKKTTSS